MAIVHIYSDGATLWKSVSQSMTTLRMKMSKLRGWRHCWYNIGLCPCQSDEAKALTDERRRREKNYMFQRFIILVTKPIKTHPSLDIYKKVLLSIQFWNWRSRSPSVTVLQVSKIRRELCRLHMLPYVFYGGP